MSDLANLMMNTRNQYMRQQMGNDMVNKRTDPYAWMKDAYHTPRMPNQPKTTGPYPQKALLPA
tara:strand:- start:241 stop:429 length:189 start_codon:yes stop_codon:yes gene_type:complete